METAVILSTYNWPRALELAIWGYAAQTYRQFTIVIADDGSGSDTVALIERLRAQTGLRMVHIWQPDRGFRKAEILNRAIIATDADYLIFSDADTIPRNDFVATHLKLAERGRYLAGGYVKLTASVSAAITVDDVTSQRSTQLQWLWSQGFRPRKHTLRFIRNRLIATALDTLTSFKLRFHGSNASTWRDYVIAADGFDMDMGYGGGDAAMGDRLANLGIRPKRIRYRTLAVHLHHERPWQDPVEMRRIVATRQAIRRNGETRARRGISQLEP